MKRALQVTALVAMGLLVGSAFAAAQEATSGPTTGGQVSVGTLGHTNIGSSKFLEYRDLSKGGVLPFVNVFATKPSFDFDLTARNVAQTDQRFTARLATDWLNFSFDYNQTPHNMGNGGHSILSETARGVWNMNATQRAALGGTADATASAARTVTFYDGLLAPTFAAASSVDVSSTRKRGAFEFGFGEKGPFALAFSYTRELKSGYRGFSGGDVLGGSVSPVLDLPEPLNEVTQDFGVRATYGFKLGNIHGSFNRNLYDNRAETLVADNPFQAQDALVVNSVGGPSRVRFINAPDNGASTGGGGFLLKFKRQTRVSGDVAFASLTQNAPFYPYTINSAVLTPAGVRADSVAALPQASFNGKIRTTSLNFTFSSRPVKGLGLRANYRSYDLTNKTQRFVITGDLSGSPDRAWAATTITADEPYGHATANPYDNSSRRFNATASYDIAALTIEGQVHTASLTRTNREATSGSENGGGVSALYHLKEWVGLRAKYDYAHRTAKGTTALGFQADEAERKVTRGGFDIELTPVSSVGLTFGYTRRHADYPARPACIVGTDASLTSCGLLNTKYDSYTAQADFTPNARAEFGFYYTYEKDPLTNRFGRTAATNMTSFLSNDRTNTFGANAVFHVVPEKWTLSLNANHQRMDGLLDVGATAPNTFVTNRGAVGVVDIADWDDTKLTTVGAQIDYAVAKPWLLSVGYTYEKYDFGDAFTSGTNLMPQSVLIFMKPDRGAYRANIAYFRLGYRF